ncbi:hypothetical protein AOC36_05840 [Erysipelothrix larvae]|uniref:FAD dependent oxidoreductase domain-containing protein n=1 Tax=Erysipelothrix larvae TaxID=1514105 RepID=A0A0X8GZY3_9FIRM|nr:FAD-dependent oxidoreductase [Erysipelothrix larvae]AMC93518.1 hypothetical protein AOC36_05840 [Erysipelothrix larvae]
MKIGIIGYGIVGAILGYYLSKDSEHEVHVYDIDTYQGTKNAVGIICPWVSQRRNKTWYHIAKEGVKCLHELSCDMNDSSFMIQNGVLLFHENLDRFYTIALDHAKEEPIMGIPQILNQKAMTSLLPPYIKIPNQALFIPGGFQIEGATLLERLKQKSQIQFHQQWAHLTGDCGINGTDFDTICVCAGGFTSDLLDSFDIDSTMQKGMMLTLNDTYQTLPNQPVIMPQGEIDILSRNQVIAIGASHQDVFDSFDVETDVIEKLLLQTKTTIPSIKMDAIDSVMVGVRSVSKDKTPYITQLNKNVFVIAGLGSSGLTTGPYLAYKLSQFILKQDSDPSIFDARRVGEK